jgi:pterin-4a-carbinolamine dehydratase
MEAPDVRKESSMTTKSVVSRVVEVVVNQVMAGAMGGLISELKPERVQEWLAAHPEWSLEASGKALRRVRSFPSASSAAHFASFVSGLASAMEMPALLKVAGDTVHISLYSPQEQEQCLSPLTENVLALAGHVG